MLTAKQRDLLNYIEAEIASSGIAPSYRQMAEYLGVQSFSNIHRIVTCLIGRGYVVRIPNKARAMEVVRSTRWTTDQAVAAERERCARIVEGGMESTESRVLADPRITASPFEARLRAELASAIRSAPISVRRKVG